MTSPQNENRKTVIQARLFALQDPAYRDFSAKLNPSLDPQNIIGVRIPAQKALAKELKGTKEAHEFLRALPHRYLEENQLHAFLLAPIRDFDEGIAAVERFLPYADSWSVTDSIRVKAFDRAPERLLPYIARWTESDRPYTVRFAVLCLMNLFLGERFCTDYHDRVAAIHSEEYYVNMMRAWYFATALAKQYEATVPYIEQHRLDPWTHNKTIQKAIESYRVTDEHKAYLRTLKRK